MNNRPNDEDLSLGTPVQGPGNREQGEAKTTAKVKAGPSTTFPLVTSLRMTTFFAC